VSIHECERVAAHTAQREHRSEQNAAVPAKYHRKLTCPQVAVKTIGEPAGVAGFRARVEHAVAGLPVASIVSWWHHDAALAAQTLQ
jgi:hypothetical protein